MSLAVISIDAASWDDMQYLPIRGRYSLVRNVVGTFPTLTYPSHATLLTGSFSHGILHNEKECSKDWNVDATAIKSRTIFDVAAEKGLSTASVSWPVTVNAPVSYLFPEIWPPLQGDEQIERYKEVMSPGMIPFFEKHRHILKSFKGRDLDSFSTAVFSDILRECHPDLAFLHLADIDCCKHQGFIDYSFISGCLERIYAAANDYDIILLSDHSQRKSKFKFSLRKAVDDERLLFQEGAFFSYVYTDGVDDVTAYEKLCKARSTYPDCIGEILCSTEVYERYHVKGAFSFVVEAVDGVYFTSSEDVLFSNVDKESFSMASHGYLPEKGPYAFFLLSSERASGKKLDMADMVDIAPTIASFIGFDLKCDGKVLEDLYE